MPEQLKVFVNKTLTTADLVNGNQLPLFTNTATTQAVVRDVQIDESASSVTQNAALVNDGFTISSTAQDMQGMEIVDKGKSLWYELRPTPPNVIEGQRDYIWLNGSTTTLTTSQGYLFYERAYPITQQFKTLGKQLNDQFVTKPLPTMYSPSFIILSRDGTTAYYEANDGSATTNLYYATADANGNFTSWSSIVNASSNSDKAVDYVQGLIRWVSAGALNTLDINTGTQTSSSGGFSGGSTYSCSSTYKDLFIWSPVYNGNVLQIYDFTINTLFTVSVTHTIHTVACVYDTTVGKYYVYAGTGNTYSVYEIVEGSGTATLVYNVISALTQLQNQNNAGVQFAATADGHIFGFMWDGNANVNAKAKLDVNGLTIVEKYPNITSAGTAFFIGNTDVSTSPVNHGPTPYDIALKVKVSGVEITGV